MADQEYAGNSGRGVYLDLRQIVDECMVASAAKVSTHTRLHTVMRTLEGLGYVTRFFTNGGGPALDEAGRVTAYYWTLTPQGRELYEELASAQRPGQR